MKIDRQKISDEFYDITNDILTSEQFQAMASIKQHSKHINRVEHSFFVAYTSFVLAKRLGLDCSAVARAALLHDFELSGALEPRPNPVKLLFTHNQIAVEHASRFFELSDKEINIIESHMWPVTPLTIPSSREAALICMVDKCCATVEKFGFFRKTKTAQLSLSK